MRITRPIKYLWQKRLNQGYFIFWLLTSVTAFVGIVRFIPNIPGENSIVRRESSDDTLYISFAAWILRRILQAFGARALHPTGIVNAGTRLVLFSEVRIGIPAG